MNNNDNIAQIPFVASEVHVNRLERIIHGLILLNTIQMIINLGIIIYFIKQ